MTDYKEIADKVIDQITYFENSLIENTRLRHADKHAHGSIIIHFAQSVIDAEFGGKSTDELIGWRRINGELVAHYYKYHRTSESDAISLCDRFYAISDNLIFPGPGMAFCSDCTEKAIRLVKV